MKNVLEKPYFEQFSRQIYVKSK